MQADTDILQPHLTPQEAGLASHLAAQVRAYHDAIRESGSNFQALHENIVSLENLIFSEPHDSPVAELVLGGLTDGERAHLNDAYCRWETEVEYRFAREVVAGQVVDITRYHLAERFGQLLRREMELLDTPPRRVLFIGSGPLPISAYYAHQITGAPVDCLDRDPEAVAMSQQVMEKLGLSDSIRVLNGPGESFNVTDYDVILIALLAKPKRRILRNVLKKAAPGCRVLCRTSFGLRTLVYEPTPEDVLLGFEVKSKQTAGDGQTISTFCLEGTTHGASNVKLRWLGGIDDREADMLLQLMNRVLRSETTIGFPGPLDPAAGRELIERLDDDIRSGGRHVLVAERGGRLVGQVILTPHPLPNCRHLIELSRGIIDPSFRGIGLSLSAFGEIARKCEELGNETIYLDVRAGTVAAELWKSFGFVPFGTLPDYARADGRSYSGLYLWQTVASLKKQVERLSRRASPSPPVTREESSPTALAAAPSFDDYRARRVSPLPRLEFAQWRVKVHGVCAEGVRLEPALVEAARVAARRILPQPGDAPPQRYGVGFLIVHAGLDADFVVVCWWGMRNELFLRVLTSPPGQSHLLRERSNMDGSVACVWDLAVIWSEREAWSKYVMRSGGADMESYLAAVLDGEI